MSIPIFFSDSWMISAVCSCVLSPEPTESSNEKPFGTDDCASSSFALSRSYWIPGEFGS